MIKKNDFQPEPQPGELTGPRYWRSLDDLAETPAFREWLEREFPENASEMDGVDRRQFMKVMAASFGLAGVGLSGCRRPKMHVLAYSEQPENIIPGVPVYYSTSYPTPYENLPLVVETHSSRPTKIEGNPSYKPYGGSTSHFAQASVLDLYDPDRATTTRDSKGNSVSLADLYDRLDGLHGKLRRNRGKGFVFVAESSSSPTRERLVAALQKQYPQATWAEYNAIDFSNPEQAMKRYFRRHLRPVYRFEKARRVVSLDGDFVSREPGSTGYARAFAKTRKVDNTEDASRMSRLYSVESDMTLTGGMADHRLRLSTSEIPAFAGLLAAEILEMTGSDKIATERLREKGIKLKVDRSWIVECARDLMEHKGEAVVFAGSHLPEEVHFLTALMNARLESVQTAPNDDEALVAFIEVTDNKAASLEDVAKMAEAGDIHTLVVIGGNPAYDAPAGIDWKSIQDKAGEVIRFSPYADETSAGADLHVAASHYLETWSDGRTWFGTRVPVQPMIEPLFNTIGDLEFIARILGELDTNPYNLVRKTFDGSTAQGETDQAFSRFLADGVMDDGTRISGESLNLQDRFVNTTVLDFSLAPPELGPESLEVRLVPSSQVWDGRHANNGWLQECPEPMSKLTWDNAILIGPRLAKKLQDESGYPLLGDPGMMQNPLGQKKFAIMVDKGLWKRGKEYAPMGEITIGDKTLRGPIHVMPGLASYTVILPAGYGRTQTGRVGTGAGFNFYSVRNETGQVVRNGATLKILEDEPTYKLANTQEHWSMEGRAIVREATTEDYIDSVDTYVKKNGKDGSFVDKMGMESHSPPIYGRDKNASLQEKSLEQQRGMSLYGHPAFGEPPQYSRVWSDEEKAKDFIPPQQWGMTIDLNLCTGCNACVVACQSENNIPVVGKDQVLRGREMHWIRLDRYFAGRIEQAPDYPVAAAGHTGAAVNHGAALNASEGDDLPVPEDVQVTFQAMACQHCELAPCESVCPVNATVHDNQGLNVMAYNRCVGTRYCANNCPYKVRRFNFFDWNKRTREDVYKGPLGEKRIDQPNGKIIEMVANPDVTVRMRGVMEKCTYCVQRIESAKINHKVKMAQAGKMRDIHVPDGKIKVACQQVCPSEAITFGDISDPDSAVSKAKMNNRDYSVLGYLNIRPRTTYLARLRNPNPRMPGTYTRPFGRQDYELRYGHGDHHADAGHGEDAHAAPETH